MSDLSTKIERINLFFLSPPTQIYNYSYHTHTLLSFTFENFASFYGEIFTTLGIDYDDNVFEMDVYTNGDFRSFISKYFSYRQNISINLAHNIHLIILLKHYYTCQNRINILKEKNVDITLLEKYDYIVKQVDEMYHLYELCQNILLDPENKWSMLKEYVFSTPTTRTCYMLQNIKH